MAKPLNLETLESLALTASVPQYARSDLSPGIVHIGVGNFHRAHMALYLDQLFNTGRDHDWAIIGAGIKSFDAARRDILKQQDWLTTVVELDVDNLSARVTGPMIDFCPIDATTLVTQLSDPAIRIVSLTVTEGGYFVDAKTGLFDKKHPEIVRDASRSQAPETVFGMLLQALAQRRAAGVAPFTILSCDNLPENGHVTRNAVLGLAKMISGDLHDWVRDHVAFPNSMVDCITPATTEMEKALVQEQFGIIDSAPVVCEPFRQWTMEDNFPMGRPRLEDVGVKFVDHVLPYETMKLRILNAGHAAIAYPAALLGHEFVHDAMADPDIENWLVKLMTTDVIPVLPNIPGVDVRQYLNTCVSRFSNPRISDTIGRLCQDGSNRQPKFILPTVRDAIGAGGSLDLLALEVAFWCRYCAASAEPNSGLKLQDERVDILQEGALATRSDPVAFLKITSVFGDLAANARFARKFSEYIQLLWKKDTRAVLQELSGTNPT